MHNRSQQVFKYIYIIMYEVRHTVWNKKNSWKEQVSLLNSFICKYGNDPQNNSKQLTQKTAFS